jgi:hypothetical protein
MRTTILFLTSFTTIFLLSITSVLAQQDVYRWVDEDGVVHFESQAPRQTEAEKIHIKPDRKMGIQPAPDTYDGDEGDSGTSIAQQKRDKRAKQRKQAKEKKQFTAAACEASRNVVATLEPKTRVLVHKEDGTVVRMDDNDRLERIREEKAYIAENCNN